MESFTPLSGAIGGVLIGLASTLLMLLNGRIAGITGIFGDILVPRAADKDWRLAFIVGLILAPIIAGLVATPLPAPAMPGWPVVIVAGLLVGFGTRLGGGCTSGHGICGISRFSPRSITATGIFMVVAVFVVALTRHVIGG